MSNTPTKSRRTSKTAREVERLQPWFHNLHLPDGTQTAPNHSLGDFPSYKWQKLAPHLPHDLSGWTALDIGCNAGYYTVEMALRGAQVTGIDVDAHYLDQARWVARQFGLEGSVQFRQMQIYDLAHTAETYDLVLFMGVMYHLRYPMLGLDIVAEKVKRQLVFQTLTMPGMEVAGETTKLDIEHREVMQSPGWPKMAFIEHCLADDPTNWWAPNHSCIEAMLRSSGMKIRSYIGHEIYLCEPDPQHPSCVTTWNRA